jgi:AcrR family transcriptional regulator
MLNTQTPSRGAGRPRDRRAHQAILRATSELALERGFTGLTIEGVARRAGVAKTTIYRWWKTKAQLVLEACFQVDAPPRSTPEDDLSSELHALVGRTLRAQTTPLAAQVLPGLVAELNGDAKLRESVREHLRTGHEHAREALAQAAERGELASAEDSDLLGDALAGMLFWRNFVTGEGCDAELVERMVAFLGRALRE